MTRLTQRRRNPRNPQTDTPAFKRWFGKSVTKDRNGDPEVFYHGSDEPGIDVFDVQRTSYGYFFTPDVDTAAYYGDNVYEAYLKIENLADFDDPLVFDRVAREALAYTEERDKEAVQAFAARLFREGYGKNPAVTAFFDAQPGVADVLAGEWDVEDMLNDNDVADWEVDKLVANINLPNVTDAYNRAAPARSEELREAEEAYGGQDFYMNYQNDFLHAAENLGYDGVVLTDPSPTGEAISYVVFSPKQIKSATGNAGTFDPYDPSMLRNPRRPATTAERTDPDLWEAVKREVTAGSKGGRPGQWSARKAQLAVALYKQRGGGYWGAKDPRNALTKWTREKWRTKSGRPSLETGERYLPSRAIAALTDAEYAATSRAKRAGMRKGQQFVPQPEDVALKVRAYRRNTGYEPLRWEDGDDEDDLDFEASGEMLDATSALLHGMSLSGQGKPSADEVSATWQRTGVYPKARALYLHSISVSPGLRGTGEGRRYVSYIENDVRRRGAEVVVLHADHSLGFWQKQGYSLWPSPPPERPEMSAIMYKVLGRTNPARRAGKKAQPEDVALKVRAYRRNRKK